jgi:hypothetical protein
MERCTKWVYFKNKKVNIAYNKQKPDTVASNIFQS